MTPEEQRIAIAEACGWKPVTKVTSTKPYVEETSGIPNYPSDLNAMHKAEETLTLEQHSQYKARLLDNISATAAQRAEAFLRTLNLWKD